MSKLNEMMANDDQLVKVGELKEELLKEMDELYIEHVMKPLHNELYKEIRNEVDNYNINQNDSWRNDTDYTHLGYFVSGIVIAEGEFRNNMLQWQKAMKDKIKGGTK